MIITMIWKNSENIINSLCLIIINFFEWNLLWVQLLINNT